MALKLLLKNLTALFLGFVLVVLLDISLGLVGVTPISAEDPFVGFEGSRPLFVEQQPGRFVLDESKSHYFNTPQSFTMPKPADTFRIVVFGGSTTYGRPYLHATSFGAWLKKLLERYGEIDHVEVINAGGISYASYRVRRLVEEMAAYQPDLFVVYSGHNEFLETRTFADIRKQKPLVRQARGFLHHSRLYSALARGVGHAMRHPPQKTELGEEVAATLEQVGGPELYHRDEEFREGVIRQYRHEMQQIARLSRENGIPLVLSTLPANLSDISPFKSELAEHLEAEEIAAWQKAFDQGLAALANGDAFGAIQLFSTAEQIDDSYALLHYRKGQALESVGEFIRAYEAYDKARQEDIVPLRILNEMNMIIREVAAKNQLHLADVEQFFIRVAPNNLPGRSLFADHVHPTIEGQQMVAWSILNTATQQALVPLAASDWSANMTEARNFLRTEAAATSDEYRMSGLWGVGRLFFWAGKYEEAYEPLLQAWQVLRDRPEISRQLGSLELLQDRPKEALRFYDDALEIDPLDYGAIVGKADALVQLGHPDEALKILDLVPEQPQANSELLMVRGRGQLALGRVDEGLQTMHDAVNLAPEAPNVRYNLALALATSGRLENAKQTYRVYLRLTRNSDPDTALAEWLANWETGEQ